MQVDITCPHCHHTYLYKIDMPNVQRVDPGNQPKKKKERKPSKFMEKVSRGALFLMIIGAILLWIASSLKDDGSGRNDSVKQSEIIDSTPRKELWPVEPRITEKIPDNENGERIISDVKRDEVYLINGDRMVDTDGDGAIDKIY